MSSLLLKAPVYGKTKPCQGHCSSAGGLLRGGKFLPASSGDLLFQLLPAVTHPLAMYCCGEPGSVFSTTPLAISVAPAELAPVNQHVSCLGTPKSRSNALMWSKCCMSCWLCHCSRSPACSWPPLLPGQCSWLMQGSLPARTHAGIGWVSLCLSPARHHGNGLGISQ